MLHECDIVGRSEEHVVAWDAVGKLICSKVEAEQDELAAEDRPRAAVYLARALHHDIICQEASKDAATGDATAWESRRQKWLGVGNVISFAGISVYVQHSRIALTGARPMQ